MLSLSARPTGKTARDNLNIIIVLVIINLIIIQARCCIYALTVHSLTLMAQMYCYNFK